MKNSVVYKNVRLMANSKAYELYQDALKNPDIWKQLDKHMKMLDINEKSLLAKYEKSSGNSD